MDRLETETPRLFCIGSNYGLKPGVEPPDEPVVFIKPARCLVPSGGTVRFPSHGTILNHEVEVVLRIGRPCRNVPVGDAVAYLDGAGLGLDLTLLDLQTELKKHGLPWEKAKAFEQSAPIGSITPMEKIADINDLGFACLVNGRIRQTGSTADMIFSAARIISSLSRIWDLSPGDLIYTGTPPGAGLLAAGDTVTVEADWAGSHHWRIVS